MSATISLSYEQAAGDTVMGIDEAGRGPLAGAVYAAAVTVPLASAASLLTGAWSAINDSKKLSPKKREILAEIIKTTPGCTWAIASAMPAEIDELNILRATHLAMRRAALEVGSKLNRNIGSEPPDTSLAPTPVPPSSPTPTPVSAMPSSPTPPSLPLLSILVDGLPVPSLPYPSRNIVKGDAKSLFIAAASILAKTARDADCLRLERLYPGYGFAKHKGYPTPAHLKALAALGPCPEHRRSFAPVADVLSQPDLFPPS